MSRSRLMEPAENRVFGASGTKQHTAAIVPDNRSAFPPSLAVEVLSL